MIKRINRIENRNDGKDQNDLCCTMRCSREQSKSLLFDAFPVHNSRLDDVKNLEENQSISQIRVQIIDERFDTQRIHPVPEH